MNESDVFDFPCSATFRHFYAEEYYGRPRLDYEVRREEDTPAGIEARLADAERHINHLYALAAMRQWEITELAQRRKYKPRGEY